MHERDVETALTALAAGMKVGMGLPSLLADDAAGRALGPAAQASVRAALAAGRGLADGLYDAELVDEGGRAFARAAEQGGFLPAALQALADDAARRRKRRAKLVLATAYPALLVVAAAVLLPLPRLFTGGLRAYVQAAALPVVVVVSAMIALAVVLPRLGPRSPLRRLVDGIVRAIPGPGGVVVAEARAASCELLARLIGAGVPMIAAARASFGAAASSSIERGGTLADALAATGLDRRDLAQMAIAEKTGTLDRALPAVAADLRARADGRMVALLATTTIVLFLAVAGSIAIAIVGGARGYVDQIERVSGE